MLDGGGAERVARGEHHRLAVRREELRQLGDRRRLAGAVDADDENHRRLFRGELERRQRLVGMPDRAVGPLEQVLQRVLDRRPDLRQDDRAAEMIRPQLGDDLPRRGDAHVGANQPGLELFELGLVENLARL